MVKEPTMKVQFSLLSTFLSSIISSLLLFLLNFIFGEDRAGVLASVLHLGNGVILAALLGGITGLWLPNAPHDLRE